MNALGRSVSRLSTIATLVDALVEITRGRRLSGALLLVAAALSSRIPGLGTLASIAIRVARRVR